MELKEAIQYALEGKAILFAGSGFSHGATNFRGEKFKTGIGLRNSLAKSCGIDAKEYSLSAVADFYTESSGHSENDLISFLIDEFTLGEIAPAHEIIMSIKWKRIYTTNYDLVIEEGAKLNKNPLFSVTLEDHLETYPKEQVCVHINGSIHNLTVDSLKNSFRLTDRSYDSETLVGKPWFIPLESLLRVLKQILIVANNLYTSDQRYEELMKAIVSHANFLYWIQKTEYVSLVKNFYDDLRLLAYFSTRNPFYWEQFASVCIDAKDFVTAKLCLENAFKEAEKIPGFVPFQVETVYARYLVEQLIYDITLGFVAPDMIVSTLMDASKRLIKHYTHPDDEHYHVFRLFNKIVCIFREHLSGMSNRDTLIFLEQMVHFRRLLADYQQESESIYFSDVANWLKNLDETIELSKKHTKK